MADFMPKKSANKAKSGQGPAESGSKDAEYQAPPMIHLDHQHLEKLMPAGSAMPPVGSKIKINGLAHVGSASENQDSMAPAGKGKTRRSMTLHLHQMEMGADGPDNDVAQEEQSKAGAKAEMDKALSKGAGSESKKGGKKD
jgi:hypothetical protein